MMMRKLALFVMLALPMSLWAEDLNPDGGGIDPNDMVPIDGGLSLLLAAGAAYGGKKVYDMRKQQGKQEKKD